MSLHIPINSEWMINSDKNQFILFNLKNPNYHKYFSNFSSLIEYLFWLKIRDSNSKTLENLSEVIKQAENRCITLITTYQKWLLSKDLEEGL